MANYLVTAVPLTTGFTRNPMTFTSNLTQHATSSPINNYLDIDLRNGVADEVLIDLRAMASPINGYFTRIYIFGDYTPGGVVDTIKYILPPGWSITMSQPNAYSYPRAGGVVYYELTDNATGRSAEGGFISVGPGAPIIVCFTTGAKILMADGTRKLVQDLSVGDMVVTHESGAQPVRWRSSTALNEESLDEFNNFRPIKFSAGALGDHGEFSVSAQHKILIKDDNLRDFLGESQGLIRAKHLVNGSTITVDEDCSAVEYFHVMFDKHEIINADGIWSESFFPGEYILSELSLNDREEIRFMFPDVFDSEGDEDYRRISKPLIKSKHVKYLMGT